MKNISNMSHNKKESIRTGRQYFSIDSSNTPYNIGEYLDNNIPFDAKQIGIFCIGSDASVGDSIGPIVGSLLQKERYKNYTIIGSLNNTINATNIERQWQQFRQQYPDAFTIAVDSSTYTYQSSIHKICIENIPLYPGIGVKKKLLPVGDISICGILNVLENDDRAKEILLRYRLSKIQEMSEVIFRGIQHFIEKREYLKSHEI